MSAQSGQRRVLGGQLIQHLPNKSQQQLFAMRLSRVDPEVVAARIKRKKEKEKRKLEAEKLKEKSEEKDSSSSPAATAEETMEEDVLESESEDEDLDEEMLRPLPTFEICKHWRNTVTSPKHVPCSVMGEWGCLYLLHELKKNLATQDKTRITKSIDNYFHHSKRAKGVSMSFYQQQEHTLYIALKDALTLICPGIAASVLPLLPSEIRGVQFLKNC